jgi:transposase
MIWKPARKTDREAARKIARFIQRYPEEELPLAEVPSVEEEELGSLVSMKGFLTKLRTQAVNRLHAVYARTGITDLKKSSLGNWRNGSGKKSETVSWPLMSCRCPAWTWA